MRANLEHDITHWSLSSRFSNSSRTTPNITVWYLTNSHYWILPWTLEILYFSAPYLDSVYNLACSEFFFDLFQIIRVEDMKIWLK